jgi:uncharacterized membrane protein
MKTRNYFAWGVALAAILVIVLMSTLSYMTPATAAPAAAVTPVAGVVHSGVAGNTVTFWSTDVITADGCSALQNIEDHAKVDLQWVINQGTVNTATFTTRWTNTGSTANLVTDATVVSANAADVTAGGQFALFGRQACIYADVTNSNPLTVTFIGVAK